MTSTTASGHTDRSGDRGRESAGHRCFPGGRAWGARDATRVEKLYDVVGLYLNPPDRSLGLCVDEKSQIQALDRTQPGRP